MRVAIVNDLKLAVEVQKRLVASEPGCELAWTAADGAEAVSRCRADRPDLVLMDLVMPVMDGVEATRRIVREFECPILVVTSTIEGHLDRVYDALGAGALDAVTSPTFAEDGSIRGGEAVLKKIRLLRRLQDPSPGRAAGAPDSAVPPASSLARQRLVLLGASTGGPDAVAKVLQGITPAMTGPIVLVQHLDPEFVAGLSEWLSATAGRPVKSVAAGDRPEPGAVQVAASDDHLLLLRDGTFGYDPRPIDNPYRPSVDVFFESVARHWPSPGLAAVLTGMGRDGAEGLLALRKVGWETFAQDEETSVVYGMPRAAKEIGAARHVLPILAIGPALEAAWHSAPSAALRPKGG